MKIKRDDVEFVIVVIAAIAVVYALIAQTVFRYRHPELTETQLFLRFWDAMRWR